MKTTAIGTRAEKSAQKSSRRVSVALPPELDRRVARFARSERRLISPALVVLIEKGLSAVASK